MKIRNKIYRVIDANFNRAKEGLRVCEDVCRFVLDDRFLTKKFKEARHILSSVVGAVWGQEGLKHRNISEDVGRPSIDKEFDRKNVQDIFYANSQRVKESVRVLEEFAKLFDHKQAEALKTLRYDIYFLEQKGMLRMKAGPKKDEDG